MAHLLWQNRNKLVWEGKSDSTRGVAYRSLKSLSGWRLGGSLPDDALVAEAVGTPAHLAWKRPAPNWISCCVDAAVFTGCGAVSMIRRDHNGRFLGASVQNYPHFRDPAVLEVLAIREALSWIKARKLSNVVIESDCLVAVNVINSFQFFSSNYGLLILDCRDILTTLVNVRVAYLRRSAKLAAHSLVRAFGSRPGSQIWGYQAPLCISAILASEFME